MHLRKERNAAFLPIVKARGIRRRDFDDDDKRMSVADWARELGMPYEALYARIKRKWSIEKAFTTPIQCHKKKG